MRVLQAACFDFGLASLALRSACLLGMDIESSGKIVPVEELLAKIDSLEKRFADLETGIHAFLPEPNRFDRLRREARSLIERFPSENDRPPLFGFLAGVKDIFRVDGFETRAGSRLPAEALAGAESSAVGRLKAAGALIIGKTVTTEFAYFGPGPTRNPHSLEHTPGGSSSGSAAAAAAGLCDVALGTQTIGSINRPAAFCGVFGFKPSYGRIATDGIIPLAPSFDHAGVLGADLRQVEAAAAALSRGWQTSRQSGKPRLGIPDGVYLDHCDATGMEHFEAVTAMLRGRGFDLKEIPHFADFEAVVERHRKVLAFEAARVHRSLYDPYKDRYHSKTAELIEAGRRISEEEHRVALADVEKFRREQRNALEEHDIDAWITPAARGPAPHGLESTGDPVMNLPWTQAGLPTLTIPTGTGPDGLPLGTQLAGRWYCDETLFRCAEAVAAAQRG